MWGKIWIGSNILIQKYHNITHIAGQSMNMEKRLQMAPDIDEVDILNKKDTKIIQSILGTMIYYTRSVGPTMLREINEILQVQSWPTRDTEEKSRILLDYVTTYPNSVLCYKAINMVLQVD